MRVRRGWSEGADAHPGAVGPHATGRIEYPAAVDIKALQELELSSADGGMHRIGDHFADRKVVLVFLRHFG